jgi:hypothetical protein
MCDFLTDTSVTPASDRLMENTLYFDPTENSRQMAKARDYHIYL